MKRADTPAVGPTEDPKEGARGGTMGSPTPKEMAA
jgi:hypothetical protein